MKLPHILLLMIIPALLTGFTGCSAFSGGSTVQTVTKSPDGSTITTTAPVLAPKDASFHEMCLKTLNSQF